MQQVAPTASDVWASQSYAFLSHGGSWVVAFAVFFIAFFALTVIRRIASIALRVIFALLMAGAVGFYLMQGTGSTL